MTVLVVNAGSSSLKFRVFDARDRAAPRPLARGTVERIGASPRATFQREGDAPLANEIEAADHAAALSRALAWIRSLELPPIDAVGHRVVHGGERFRQSVLIDDQVLDAIEQLENLAPLHNAPGLAAIRACRDALGQTMPMVAVFDTSFHATLPEPAYRYAIPWELALAHGVRRFGFHGSSYRHVLARYAELAGVPIERVTIVALHLGAGSSATAIKNGRSVDTSMGLTPLEGLMMATRSGDLDPSIVGFLSRAAGVPVEEVERWLNQRSGVLGIAGTSHDFRDLLTRDDPRARLAVEMYCARARKFIGAYLAALGGADAVVFTGGVGEHQPEIRARICANMEWCGLALDEERNRAAIGSESVISSTASRRLRALVIPTDEELVIARDTLECVRTSP